MIKEAVGFLTDIKLTNCQKAEDPITPTSRTINNANNIC